MGNDLSTYLAGRRPLGFKSLPFYSREGDFLTYYFEDHDHYAEQLDEHMTVYRSMAGDKIVGFKLQGVAHLCRAVAP